MELTLHPQMSIKSLTVGAEKAPLLVIDNFIEQADSLVDLATKTKFKNEVSFYPGMRCESPAAYKQLLLESLHDELIDYFQLKVKSMHLTESSYSIITKPATELILSQRIPHFDSVDKEALGLVHYLFKDNLGGTSFYRHKKTNFESIEKSSKADYFASLDQAIGTADEPTTDYINGDTALFERIADLSPVFNRMIVYRQNVLHSGSIAKNFEFNADPLYGRLSINSFLAPVR